MIAVNPEFDSLFQMAERGKAKVNRLRVPQTDDMVDIAWQDNAQREVIPPAFWPYLVALDHKVDEGGNPSMVIREVRIPGHIYFLMRVTRKSGRWVRLGEAEPTLFATFLVPRACPGICAPNASDGPRFVDWQDFVFKGNDPEQALYYAQIEGAYVQRYQQDWGDLAIAAMMLVGK